MANSNRRLPTRFLWRVLIVALMSASAAALIEVSFSHRVNIRDILRFAEFTLVYACSISFPSALTLYRLRQVEFAGRRGMLLLFRTGILLCTSFFGCLVGAGILYLIGLVPKGDYWIEFRGSVGLCVVLTLTFGLSMHFYEETRLRLEAATVELHRHAMEEERAHKLLAEARLSSLESRIHPHFLFNTLNSIASLIPKDPKQAEDLVGKLASLLRFSLNANQTGLVPLSQELKLVRDYLEIEKTRFGARLRYEIQVPAALDNQGVPPLSLQSLVENSVKHVISPRPEGGRILVTASQEEARVSLEVRDDGPGFDLASIPAGHGLENLSDRLALLFGPQATLQAARDGTQAVVRVSLPHRTEPAA
jgi:two-component system sensor histidine kinase AlgZ